MNRPSPASARALCATTAVLLLAGIAACSSSGSGKPSHGTSAGGSTGSGAPVSVMVEGTFAGSTNPSFATFPDAETSVKSYLDRLNKSGGINGHQIHVISCNDQASPDVAAQCARQAVSKHVVAVISPTHSANGVAILPVLEAAKIPFINQPFTPPDYTSPMSFTVGSGLTGVFGATAIAAVQSGCKKIAALSYDIAAATALVDNMSRAVKPLNVTIKTISVSPTASSFAGVVAAVQDGKYDCLLPVIAPTQLHPAIQAIKAAGLNVRYAMYEANFSDEEAAELAKAGAEGALITSQWLPESTKSALMTQLKSDFKAAGVPFTDVTVGGWTDARLFDLVARSIQGEITAATFLDALEKADNLDLGTIPPYSTQHPLTIKGYTRVFDHFDYVSVLENGKLVTKNPAPIDATAAYGS